MKGLIVLNKRKIFAAVFAVLSAALMLFIWLHSLAPANISANESTDVLIFLQGFFDSVNINAGLTDFLVRKAAHFCEFALLGAVVTTAFRLYADRISRYFFNILFILLAVPVIDEGLQYFAPGRSPQVNDIMLDFCGCMAGMLFALIIMVIIKAIGQRKKGSKKGIKKER